MEVNHKNHNQLPNDCNMDCINAKNIIKLLSSQINDNSFINNETAISDTIDKICNLCSSKSNVIDVIIIDLIDISTAILILNNIDIRLRKNLFQSINEIIDTNYSKYINNCNFISSYIKMITVVSNNHYYDIEKLSTVLNLVVEVIDCSKETFKNDYIFIENSIYAINYILTYDLNQPIIQSKQKIIDIIIALIDNNIYTKKNDYILIQTVINLIYNTLYPNIDTNLVKKLINNVLNVIPNLNLELITDNTKAIIIQLFQFIITNNLIYDIKTFEKLINQFIQYNNKKSNNSDYVISFIHLINTILNRNNSNINNKKCLSQIAIELFTQNYESLKDNEFFYCNLVRFTKNLIMSELFDIDQIINLININFNIIINKYNVTQEYCEFQSDCTKLIISILRKTDDISILNKEVINHIINHININYNKLFEDIYFKYEFTDFLVAILFKMDDIELIKHIIEVGIRFTYDNTNIINQFKYDSNFIIRLLKFNNILIKRNKLLKILQNDNTEQELINNEIKLLTHIVTYNIIIDHNDVQSLINIIMYIMVANINISNIELLIQFGNKLILNLILDDQCILKKNDIFVIKAINFTILTSTKFKVKLNIELIIAINDLITSNFDTLKSNNYFLNISIYFIYIVLKQKNILIFTRENILSNLTKLITYAIHDQNNCMIDEDNKKNIINLLFEIFNKKTNTIITDDLINYGIDNVIEHLKKFKENNILLQLSSAIIKKIDNNVNKFNNFPVFLINFFKGNYKNYKENTIIINDLLKLILNISNLKLEQKYQNNLYNFTIKFIALSYNKLVFDDYNLLNDTLTLINRAIQHKNYSENKYKLVDHSITLIKIFLDKFANTPNDFDLVSLLISTIKNCIPSNKISSSELLKQQENRLIELKTQHKNNVVTLQPTNTEYSNQNNTLQSMKQCFEKASIDIEKNIQPIKRRRENTVDEEQYISERRTEIANENNKQFQNKIQKFFTNLDKRDNKLFK